MNNLRQTDDGFGYYYEDGQLVVVNPGSGNLCNPGAMTAWMEARDQNSAILRKKERTEDAKAARKQKAEDIKVLGPVFAELAQLIRANRSAASKAKAPVALKRNKRRRRHIKGD